MMPSLICSCMMLSDPEHLRRTPKVKLPSHRVLVESFGTAHTHTHTPSMTAVFPVGNVPLRGRFHQTLICDVAHAVMM